MSNLDSISLPRLSTYKSIFGSSTEIEALKFYYWNQAVSAELYVLLHNLEICFRNRIHEVLSLEASLQASKNFAWYDQFDFSISGNTSNGKPRLSKTGEAIDKVKTDLQKKGKQLTPQNIICNLELGKWTYILKTRNFKNGSAIDWKKLFPLIFRNYSNFSTKKGLSSLFSRLEEVRLLRNRIAHLEPVWKFGSKTVNGTTVNAPTNTGQVIARLNKEITWTTHVLEWICKDSYNHYIGTNSYRKLRILVSDPGVVYFSI